MKEQVINEALKQENVESVQSYLIGGAGITLASLADVANAFQSVAIIIGCFVVAVRLIHDAVRLLHYLKSRK